MERAVEISNEDWEAVSAIAMAYGGNEAGLRCLSQSLQEFISIHGPADACFRGHRYPVYRWLVQRGRGKPRVKIIIIDLGQCRLALELGRVNRPEAGS